MTFMFFGTCKPLTGLRLRRRSVFDLEILRRPFRHRPDLRVSQTTVVALIGDMSPFFPGSRPLSVFSQE